MLFRNSIFIFEAFCKIKVKNDGDSRNLIGFLLSGTSKKTNPMAVATFQKNSIFTNVAETANGEYYWEGLEDEIADKVRRRRYNFKMLFKDQKLKILYTIFSKGF